MAMEIFPIVLIFEKEIAKENMGDQTINIDISM